MQKLLRQTLIFPAKEDIAVVFIFNVAVNVFSLCGEIVVLGVILSGLLEKILQAVVICDIQLVPVVKTGTF